MATETCIKTRDGTYCKASPIMGCGCNQPPFEDPYEKIPLAEDKLDDKDELIESLKKIIKYDYVNLAGKGSAVVAVVKLMLLREVKPGSDFIITGVERPDVGATVK